MSAKTEPARKYLQEHPNAVYADVARRFGISKKSARIIGRQLGLPSREKQKTTPGQRQSIVETIKNNPELSYSAIAEQFGVSTGFVAGLSVKSGVSRAIDFEARRKEICRYFVEHPDTLRVEIAKKFRSSPSYVSKVLKEGLGIGPVQPKVNLEKLSELMAQKPDASLQELADVFGVTRYAISAAKQRLRRPKKARRAPTYIDWDASWHIVEENIDLPIPKIAELLGVSTMALSEHLRRRGMKRGRRRKMDYAELEKLVRAKGIDTASEKMAEKYGVKKVSVLVAAQKLGLCNSVLSLSDEDAEAVAEMYWKDPQIELWKLAAKFGTTEAQISKILWRRGLRKTALRGRFSHDEVAQIIHKNPGKKYREIAKIAGVSLSSVLRVAKQFGIERRPGARCGRPKNLPKE